MPLITAVFRVWRRGDNADLAYRKLCVFVRGIRILDPRKI